MRMQTGHLGSQPWSCCHRGQRGNTCRFLYSVLDVGPEHLGFIFYVFADFIFHTPFVSCPEMSLVLVLNPSVSFPVGQVLSVLLLLVGPVVSSRGTTELSVYPWVCMPDCCSLSRYMVADRLVDGSFDLLPHVIH